MVTMEGYDHLYLSPHLDDAVFSCGGRIWQQTRAGERVAVVTVFAGAPNPEDPLSPYAEELHARWRHPTGAVRQRQAEDVRALALLSADAIHWPYLDCIYRTAPDGSFPYADEDALWGEIHASDADLIPELARRVASLTLPSGGRLYCPLAIGRHVDHRIVRRAAQVSEHHLTYYEDFPYARDPQALQAVLGDDRWEPEVMTLSRGALEAKAAAIACYRSQISTFWSTPDDIEATVCDFAEQTGGEQPGERYWRLMKS